MSIEEIVYEVMVFFNEFVLGFLRFLKGEFIFGDFGLDFDFSIGFGSVTWFTANFLDLVWFGFMLAFFIFLIRLLFKFIKWLFSIPKRIGGLK